MIPFLVVAGILVACVVGLLSYRLWRVPGVAPVDEGVDAINVLRDQKRELDSEVASGRMTLEERETRIVELTRRVHEEGLATPSTAKSSSATARSDRITGPISRRRLWLAAAIALIVPVVAIPIYLVIGNPTALDPAMRTAAAAGGHGEMSEEQVMTLLKQLRERLESNPDDARGWTMLGRGLRVVNDFAGSAQAFAKASALQPNDASLLADWADSLGMTQDRNLEGKPRELIMRALQVDPQFPKALALAASVEYAAGKFGAAKGYWTRLLAVLPPDAPSATEVREILAQLDRKTGGGGTVGTAPDPTPPAKSGTTSTAAPRPAPGSPSPAVAAITGTVKIAPSLASKIAPGDVLFIFARAVDGPRMPLAIIRGTAGELPKTFRLDDTMGMSGGPSLSSIAQVKIEARVAKSGDAIPKPGDMRGESAVVSPGMSNVDVVIDKVVQ